MTRRIAATVLAFVALATASSHAQGAPEAIVRQGDTIQWIAAAGPPHKLKFGAAGTTPIADIEAILEFKPPLVNGESKATSGTLQTATVKEDKATVGRTFVFTCGFHPDRMLSLAFTVAARDAGQTPRTHTVMGEAALHWHLHVDTTP
jgi:hypothetical protein